MATFFGTEKEFVDFIGPRIRNVVNLIAKSERDACNKICQMCKTTNVELQSAHIYGKERKTIINQVLQKYKNGDNYLIDIQQVENEIKETHYPIKETFLFLCASCHKRYDRIKKDAENYKSALPQTNYIQDKQSQNIDIEIIEVEKSKKIIQNNQQETPMCKNSSEKCNNLSENKITKNDAKKLCEKNGFNLIGEKITFASKNKSANIYWANPSIDSLSENWWILLNDFNRRELHVFSIPAHSISEHKVMIRNDKNLIDLQIKYDDNKSFEDNRSGITLKKWFVKTITY